VGNILFVTGKLAAHGLSTALLAGDGAVPSRRVAVRFERHLPDGRPWLTASAGRPSDTHERGQTVFRGEQP